MIYKEKDLIVKEIYKSNPMYTYKSEALQRQQGREYGESAVQRETEQGLQYMP